MEVLNPSNEARKFTFYGNGANLFGIFIVNVLLSVVTLGLYYPWAKANIWKYLYQELEFLGNRFTFHGTGREMFWGMVKAILFIIVLIAPVYIGGLMENLTLIFVGFAVYMIGLVVIIPAAIVGGLRYRLSRSSWRGIHFGYRGTINKMIGIYIKGFFLTIITFGIYSPWFYAELAKEVLSHTRFGNLEFDFKGRGSDLFVKIFLGYILCFLTLGIYFFWLIADLRNYFFNNITVTQGEVRSRFVSSIKGFEVLGLMIVNGIILVFTLGIAYPWVQIRNLRYWYSRLELSPEIDFDGLQQTEENYGDATGEGFLDAMDLQLFF